MDQCARENEINCKLLRGGQFEELHGTNRYNQSIDVFRKQMNLATTVQPVQPPTGDAVQWDQGNLTNPHAVADKAQRVNKMFSAIASSYDINNRLHSLWMDQHWRSVAVKMAEVKVADVVVDVACGTGDLTRKFYQAKWRRAGGAAGLPGPTLGIDFTYAMLPIARLKLSGQRTEYARLMALVKEEADLRETFTQFRPDDIPKMRAELARTGFYFIQGDALALPLPNQSADIISIAFGIRNVANWGAAIDEFYRVLKPGGRLIILEFSLPKNAILRGLYNFYFRKIMPRTATLISGDKSGAYKYLPESVNTFIDRQTMQDRMRQAGFSEVVARPLTFGICVCYRGVKSSTGILPVSNENTGKMPVLPKGQPDAQP